MALYMHIASGGTINFGKDFETAAPRLRRTPTIPLAASGKVQRTELKPEGLWPSFNVSKFQGFVTRRDTAPSRLHTLCDLSWDKIVLEQLTNNTTTISHSGCSQESCRLCQHLVRSVRRWQISREMKQSWISQRDATPRVFVPLVEKAIRNIDSDLAKLYSEHQEHLQPRLVCEDTEWSQGSSETIARHSSPSTREHRINNKVDDVFQVPSNETTGQRMESPVALKSSLILPRVQSHSIPARRQHLKAPSKICIGADSQRFLFEILSSFCWDPLRGLTIVRSSLIRCGRVFTGHVIELYRSLQQIFDEFIPFTNLLALLTVNESLRCKPQIWKRLAVTYQCTWKFRYGTVLCIMRPSSYMDGSNPKSMIVALADLKESALGNMVSKRLSSTATSPMSHGVRKITRNALPAYLALPPPPVEPLPCPKVKSVPITETNGRRDLKDPKSPTIESSRGAQYLSTFWRIVILLVSLSTQNFGRRMRSVLLLFPRLTERFDFGEPPLQQGMKRVRWRCGCGSRLYDDFKEVRPGAAKALEDRLNNLPRQKPVYDSERSRGQPSSSVIQETSASSHRGRDTKVVIQSPGNTVQYLAQHSQSSRSSNVINVGPEGRWLLVCSQSRKKPTSLTQLDVCSARSDKELFTELKQAYTSLRGRMARIISLRTVKTIKFVQFELHIKDFVDIRKVPDVPPETKKDDYIYQPCDLIPPVGEHLMTHLFHHPEDANDQRAITFLRTPKKRKQKLIVCPQEGTSIGWGIHLVEGWVLRRVWLFAFLFFLIGSLVFAVCWAVLEKDLQGAFGVSAYVVAFFGLLLGTVHAHVN